MRCSARSLAARAVVSLLSEVPFASALVYSPRGQSEESKRSRERLRDPLKRGDVMLMQLLAERLRSFLLRSVQPDIVEEFLGSDVVLVPVPRSAPLTTQDALWPARVLSEALVRGGMGERVLPCLVRAEAVSKSAFAGSGERPGPRRHYETMRVARELLDSPARITIVDDVVTKGATLIAAASRVQEAFPRSVVRAFALVRTMGLVAEIANIGEPCRGLITYDGSRADRQP
jgi:hypothetical protein